ncbi:MAG: Spy/CpxP family protein refolding chaperone, partial [Acidobacteriota bacterium]|nr:Spy/CpxP family protein refolding chaperone [Acidobacteriota bacterium]
MKIRNLLIAIIASALLCAGVFAQGDGRPPDKTNNFAQRDGRGAMIARELGLTDMQKLTIRQINQRQRLLLRDAQVRLAAAREAADVAIYSDEFDQADVETRIRNVAMAQAEITKIRLMSEVAVRNVLSPEQVVKFRELRERFREQRRVNNQRRRNSQIRRNTR